jgi:hypothetical protein
MCLISYGVLGCDTTYCDVTLKMEAEMFSETMVSHHNTTWHHNSEDEDFNLHCCENLKP